MKRTELHCSNQNFGEEGFLISEWHFRIVTVVEFAEILLSILDISGG